MRAGQGTHALPVQELGDFLAAGGPGTTPLPAATIFGPVARGDVPQHASARPESMQMRLKMFLGP